MSIRENLSHLKQSFVSKHCLLVAVSKTKPVNAIQEAYDAGIRDFGENKVQEMADKAPQLPDDIRWHMIGHLQRNKVKYIAPFVHLIHGVDSLKLLTQINKEAQKNQRVISCLLQVHIAREETKFGLDMNELKEILLGPDLPKLENIKIEGLMGMATLTDNEEIIRSEFAGLRTLRDDLSKESLPENVSLKELSMGMSGDYLIAQQEGSTMVRIGSAIFGERNYH
ncbi:MAG: YggS family pyridoxal phosphate-dependent enzyme [Lunatimonas sp.]|uniref:YggS family pyridoxal phosphate-dependent enzyme n=1 Tax=Lunatimonas sp. TaxID=2060141 RepID=UPI00263BAB54|nr:YggS family pyridoxal phosphate-dependent enzyme [Lunatimonas sp.]MCC5939037.1 YggS family pyridoxal phosphate-dependent enzyme [Lunatimonas sp.]